MPSKKIPKIEIVSINNPKWALIIDGKCKIIADDIFEYKLFDRGKKVAIIFEQGGTIKLAVAHLDEPITEFADFEPAPTPNFSIVLAGKKEDKEVIAVFRSGGLFYVLHSDTMKKICQLPDEKAANELVDARGILI